MLLPSTTAPTLIIDSTLTSTLITDATLLSSSPHFPTFLLQISQQERAQSNISTGGSSLLEELDANLMTHISSKRQGRTSILALGVLFSPCFEEEVNAPWCPFLEAYIKAVHS